MNHVAQALSPQYLRSRIGKVCVAITGSTATPPLLETMIVLGRDRVRARLRRAHDLLA